MFFLLYYFSHLLLLYPIIVDAEFAFLVKMVYARSPHLKEPFSLCSYK